MQLGMAPLWAPAVHGPPCPALHVLGKDSALKFGGRPQGAFNARACQWGTATRRVKGQLLGSPGGLRQPSQSVWQCVHLCMFLSTRTCFFVFTNGFASVCGHGLYLCVFACVRTSGVWKWRRSVCCSTGVGVHLHRAGCVVVCSCLYTVHTRVQGCTLECDQVCVKSGEHCVCARVCACVSEDDESFAGCMWVLRESPCGRTGVFVMGTHKCHLPLTTTSSPSW